MAYEQKEGSGTLFKNEKKTSDNQPDYRGELKLNGELLEVAMWKKAGSRGEFFSLNAKPKWTPKKETVTDDPDEDQIPF